MNRRTFILLAGAASGALSRPRPRPRPRPRAADGRLAFELDERRRWSLWYVGAAAPVPLVRDAVLGAWLGGRFVALGDLEDTVTGHRRPPGGEALVVRGRAAGVYVEAEFLMAEAAPAPRAAISLTIRPDRALPTVGGVRFCDVPPRAVLPGRGPLLAVVNGYASDDPCRVVTPAGGFPALPSHGALGLSRGPTGLALAFDAGGPGDGRVDVGPDALAPVSNWLPQRALRAAGDTCALRLCYTPDGDARQALAAVFVPTSPVDRERLAGLPAPAGWRSRALPPGDLTEDTVLRNMEFCATHFEPRQLRVIHVDDGYQRAVGDWEPNDKFPHGHRWLTDRIHERGFLAGLWVAPLAISERSGLADVHADWLVRDAHGPVVVEAREAWGGRLYALDGAHPGAQEWLFALARRVVRDWGYDHVTIDHLHWATAGASHYGDRTHAEAYRAALAAIREGAGPDAFLHGAGAPLQHAVGLVNAMRIGPDVQPSRGGMHAPARAAALRRGYHRSAWLNDPGCLLAGPGLSLAEAEAWATVVAFTGGVTFCADDLPALAAERLAILQKTIPAAPVAGRAADPLRAEPELARPPRTWVVEGAPSWWTVAVVNWGDEPLDASPALAELGVAGARFYAYDVWRDAPRADVRERLAVRLEPYAALVVALRPTRDRPQVVGTSRHVVQGVVDVRDEAWDAATRTLSGAGVTLDRRPYRVTVALPRGLEAEACEADPPCGLRRLESRYIVLDWPAGDGRDVRWRVRFRRVAARR